MYSTTASSSKTFFSPSNKVDNSCSWCGKECKVSKKNRCSCKIVHYCGDKCKRKAWPEHRLICSFKPRQKPSRPFYFGDIVLISGLKSASGQKMNGRLGEVREVPDDDDSDDEETTEKRIQISLDVGNLTIKTVAIKPANLTVQLTARNAAAIAGAASLAEEEEFRKKKEQDGEYFAEKKQKLLEKCAKIGQTVRKMSGSEIVQKIKEEEIDVIQALLLPPTLHGFTPIKLKEKQIEEMHDNQLAEVILSKFQYPNAIDDMFDKDIGCPIHYIGFLGNTLKPGSFGPGKALKENLLRMNVCKMLGPAILLCATKKRRLFQRTEQWWGIQTIFVSLLGNCLLTEGTEELANFSLLTHFDSTVIDTLIEYLVLILTVDPLQYLSPDTPLLDIPNYLQHSIAQLRSAAVPVLMELCDLDDDNNGSVLLSDKEDVVRRIGLTKISAGVPGLAGKTFVASFLEISARVALEILESPAIAKEVKEQLPEQLQYVYSMLSQVPALVPILGDLDEAFNDASSTEEIRVWATQRTSK